MNLEEFENLCKQLAKGDYPLEIVATRDENGEIHLVSIYEAVEGEDNG